MSDQPTKPAKGGDAPTLPAQVEAVTEAGIEQVEQTPTGDEVESAEEKSKEVQQF